jgi:hypothetical protein
LTWSQVHRWRLAQHGLSPRLNRQDVVQAVSRTGGIQAQVLSAAELALWARVQGLARADIQTALWQERTVVARSMHDSRNWAGYFAYYGLTPTQQDAFLSAIPHVLSDTPMTRQALADAFANHTGIFGVRDLILSSGWGSPLKPSAFRGDLCFGPSRARTSRYDVSPAAV